MKIYLAARYGRRQEMLEVASRLREIGHIITSRWIDGGHDVPSAQCAIEDLGDINNSDVLILFTDQPANSGKGGRHVEFGFALATGKTVLVVGDHYPENAFQRLGFISHLCSADALLDLAARWVSEE